MEESGEETFRRAAEAVVDLVEVMARDAGMSISRAANSILGGANVGWIGMVARVLVERGYGGELTEHVAQHQERAN